MTDKYDKEKRFIPEDGGSGGTAEKVFKKNNYVYILLGIAIVGVILAIVL
jgi:hypothetical protein